MKLLFVDHACHKETHSADFFVAILRRAFALTELYYRTAYRTGAEAQMPAQDGAVIWEFPISRRRFFFPGKANVFVPMYDNEWASFWQWKRIAWSGMGVISFCAKVSAHARRCGVTNILDVRYFPDPAAFPQEPGDLKRVFVWERGELSRAIAERMFPPSDGYAIDVKGAREFLPREAYLARLAACGVFLTPRRKEGIGMSFLEAMAMGKCVVAYDEATMNEYLDDGQTGFLFSERRPCSPDARALSQVRANLPALADRLRRRWLEDAEKIVPFIAEQKPCRPSCLNRLKIALAYPLYLAEGLWWRLRHG